MPISNEYKAPFACNQYYHILFRSIDGIPLFKSELERRFFLEKWQRFLTMLLETWAFSQLDNHVHLIVRIRDQQEIIGQLNKLSAEAKTKSMSRYLMQPIESLLDEVSERQVNSFMVSYANTYNNRSERRGGVFQQPFRRSIITEESHLQQAIIYTHANAQKHGLVSDFKLHNHNSYRMILDKNEEFVSANAVLDFFEGIKQFISVHTEQVAYFYNHHWPSSKLEADS